MSITGNNLQRTFQELRGFSPLIEEARTLVFQPQRSSAQPMSGAELEFALRKTSNGLIELYNTFLHFLERIESDSRRHR